LGRKERHVRRWTGLLCRAKVERTGPLQMAFGPQGCTGCSTSLGRGRCWAEMVKYKETTFIQVFPFFQKLF
jgi:hypothetical protein